MTENWTYSAASVIGTSHIELGLPCQDAHSVSTCADKNGVRVLVAVVCDGAGTAANARRGAELVSSEFHRLLASHLASAAVEEIDDEVLRAAVSAARKKVCDEAEANEFDVRSYATTLLAAVVSDVSSAFCQIGDGAIVVRDDADREWCWVFWPQHGEVANATSFATDDDFESRLEIDLGKRGVRELAVFSDGIEKLVLKFDDRTVHAPFFDTVFGPIRNSPVHEEDRSLSEALASYLSSDAICRRTDDDKTLVLATRRSSSSTG